MAKTITTWTTSSSESRNVWCHISACCMMESVLVKITSRTLLNERLDLLACISFLHQKNTSVAVALTVPLTLATSGHRGRNEFLSEELRNAPETCIIGQQDKSTGNSKYALDLRKAAILKWKGGLHKVKIKSRPTRAAILNEQHKYQDGEGSKRTNGD
ncbi:hypothetical protein B0H19DRAFT_1067743 [Mycena capillaripes]|nr:hypothetical protein B0H19DRAFT_1067743 [Mycena capillaripes]